MRGGSAISAEVDDWTHPWSEHGLERRSPPVRKPGIFPAIQKPTCWLDSTVGSSRGPAQGTAAWSASCSVAGWNGWDADARVGIVFGRRPA